MKKFGMNEIEEGCESRVGTVEAEDIYEAARLFKNITDKNTDSNYKIFEINDMLGNYLMVSNTKNDLMYYNALKWQLIDEGKLEIEYRFHGKIRGIIMTKYAIDYCNPDGSTFSDTELYIEEAGNTAKDIRTVLKVLIKDGCSQLLPFEVKDELESYTWDYVNKNKVLVD